MTKVRLRNVSAQRQEVPVPGNPGLDPGAVHPAWVDRSDSVEVARAQGRRAGVEELAEPVRTPEPAVEPEPAQPVGRSRRKDR